MDLDPSMESASSAITPTALTPAKDLDARTILSGMSVRCTPQTVYKKCHMPRSMCSDRTLGAITLHCQVRLRLKPLSRAPASMLGAEATHHDNTTSEPRFALDGTMSCCGRCTIRTAPGSCKILMKAVCDLKSMYVRALMHQMGSIDRSYLNRISKICSITL